MAKDPAFLFYSQDFIVGVQTMDFEDRGKYITILAQMHQQGRMDEKTIRFLVGSVSDNLKNKFRIDKKGLWYNERLEIESEKRAKYTESRRNNGIKGGRPKKTNKPKQNLKVKHMDNHMEDENENVIEDIIETLNEFTNSKFSPKSKDAKKHIPERLKEGYTMQDFKEVIQLKAHEWKDDPKMSNYLRPSTLFGNKFESYVQQVNRIKANPELKNKSNGKGNTKGFKYADEYKAVLDSIREAREQGTN